MRMVLVVLIIVVCLAVIAIPAFLGALQPAPESARLERNVFRPRLENMPFWVRLSPFGPHVGGWQGILSTAASWVYLYLTSALMLGLFSHRMRLVTQALKSGGGRAQVRLLLIGFLAILTSALLVLLARFAFVWFVLVIVLVGAVFVLSYLGVIAVSLMVGEAVRRWAKLGPSVWSELALGSLILFALGHIPVAGWLLVGLAAAWGLGAVLATHLGSGEAWSLRDWQVEA